MLKSLFSPQTIVVASEFDNPEHVGHTLLANLKEGGYQGKIVPIWPQGEELLGYRTESSIDRVGRELDLCIIATDLKQIQKDVERAVQSRFKNIIVVTEIFLREQDRLSDAILSTCKDHGIHLLGPASMGLQNSHHSMNASLIPEMTVPGPVSFFSQSGALSTALVDRAHSRGLRLSKFVSLGEKLDIDETEILSHLGKDEQTRVIAGYMENIGSGSEFIKVAETVSATKPVIILKVGTTNAGAKIAARRLGTPAGADIAYGAAFKRAGIVRAESFDELLDFSYAFATQPLPRGPRVGIVTNSGGAGIIATDALQNCGLELAALSKTTEDALAEQLNPGAFVSNPVDLLASFTPEQYGVSLREMANDCSIDALLAIVTLRIVSKPTQIAEAIIQAAEEIDKPLAVALLGGNSLAPAREILIKAGIPEFPSTARAVSALKALWEYASWRERPPRVVTRFPVNRRRIDRIVTRHQRTGRKRIGAIDTLEILKAYGFRTPEGVLVTNSEEAVLAAKRIGFPVSLKIVCSRSDKIPANRKEKRSLVTADEVRDGFDLLVLRMMRDIPDVKLEGVYVERMPSGGKEVIIGMSRDPHFGPMLMFGLGGIFVEVMENTAFHLAPITAEEAGQMLRSTRSFEMLGGGEEAPGIDIDAIVLGLQKLSQLATDFPQIDQVEINPLLVGEVEGESMAVSSQMVLRNGEPQ